MARFAILVSSFIAGAYAARLKKKGAAHESQADVNASDLVPGRLLSAANPGWNSIGRVGAVHKGLAGLNASYFVPGQLFSGPRSAATLAGTAVPHWNLSKRNADRLQIGSHGGVGRRAFSPWMSMDRPNWDEPGYQEYKDDWFDPDEDEHDPLFKNSTSIKAEDDQVQGSQGNERVTGLLRRVTEGLRGGTEEKIQTNRLEQIKAGGHLRFEVQDVAASKVASMVDEAHKGASISDAMRHAGVGQRLPPPLSNTAGSKNLVIFYTDFEPDDVMAVAQLWQWKSEHGDVGTDPLVICCADFASKDGGTVFEKKQLMASLALGEVKWHTLTYEGDAGDAKADDESTHPQTKALAEARSDEVAAICEKLVKFEGDQIDLYVMAPGHGNLGAILRRLREQQKWPLKQKWRVSVYSGSFNTKGMTEADLLALEEIMRCSDSPLVDMSKFPFFGGKKAHPVTDSFSVFALPSFAGRMSMVDPLLAATWKSFNDEFNVGLIHPENRNMFKNSTLDAAETERLATLKQVFESEGVNVYAKKLHADEALFAKVADYKKNTVLAFASDSCDSPICDQLLFLYEWLVDNEASWLTQGPQGKWVLDERGYTSIDTSASGGISAIQPILGNHGDEKSLQKLREITEAYIFKHLASLQKDVSKGEAYERGEWTEEQELRKRVHTASVARAMESSNRDITQEDEIDEYTSPLLIAARILAERDPEKQVGPQRPEDAGKLTVVLDLDECLVHTRQQPGRPVRSQQAEEHKVDPKALDEFVFQLEDGQVMRSNRRPGLQRFLETASKDFELMVYTAGKEVYAKPLLDHLDPKGTIFRHRLYRDSCVDARGAYTKDLARFNRPMNRILLVDNNPINFLPQLQNGVPITPFYDDQDDTALTEIASLLDRIKNEPDVRPSLTKKFNLEKTLLREKREEILGPSI